MFHHLHVQDNIELLTGLGHRFGCGVAVIDGQAGLFSMHLRHGNVAFSGIGTNNIGPQPRHRFRQKPATAADIKDS